MKSDINPTGTYLRIIYELEEAGVVARRARICERIAQSAATVGQAVGRMARDGLVVDGAERRVELTEIGRARAVTFVRKQRLAECFLVDVIGLDPERGHVEACLWQHVISDRVERKLVTLLDGPSISPCGLPIPGLELLSTSGTPFGQRDLPTGTDQPLGQRLDDFARCGGGAAEVCSIDQPWRSDPALNVQLVEVGIQVGSTLTVSAISRRGRPVSVHTAGASVKLPTALAQAVRVRAN